MTSDNDPAEPQLSSKHERRGHNMYERIIVTAEELFGLHGIDAVSMRRIGAAAGQSNPFVVQYYFGTRENLIQKILEFRVAEMEKIRQPMLEKLRHEGRTRDIRSLLEIVCLPIVSIVDENGMHSYSRFLSEYMLRYYTRGIRHPSDYDPERYPAISATLSLMRERQFFLRDDIAEMRRITGVIIFLDLLTRHDAERLSGEATVPLNLVIAEAIEMACFAMLAPPSGPDALYSPPEGGAQP